MKSACVAACLLAIASTRAQDTRAVSEPRIPPACATVAAEIQLPLDEQHRDTARIQQAIDGCESGSVMLVAAGDHNAFLSGPLRLKAGVTLVVAQGATLYASADPRDYDQEPASCGIVGRRGAGCQPLILAEHAPGSGVMGDGVIDGRGGAQLAGQAVSWWDLAQQAKVADLIQACPRILVARQSDGFTLYRVTLRNSPNFHVVADRVDGFTAWGVKIAAPPTARNTDGIDPASSSNVTITDCDIDTGDDNVAIKAGSRGPSAHISILNNRFYHGHGMSIGSETDGGVSAVLVRNLTIAGADNGIRIKSDRSRGGVVENVRYENVCMTGVKEPLVFTTAYSKDATGGKLPVYRNIFLTNVTSLTAGRVTILGIDARHPLDLHFDNVAVPRDAKHSVQRFANVTESGRQTPIECVFAQPPSEEKRLN